MCCCWTTGAHSRSRCNRFKQCCLRQCCCHCFSDLSFIVGAALRSGANFRPPTRAKPVRVTSRFWSTVQIHQHFPYPFRSCLGVFMYVCLTLNSCFDSLLMLSRVVVLAGFKTNESTIASPRTPKNFNCNLNNSNGNSNFNTKLLYKRSKRKNLPRFRRWHPRSCRHRRRLHLMATAAAAVESNPHRRLCRASAAVRVHR